MPNVDSASRQPPGSDSNLLLDGNIDVIILEVEYAPEGKVYCLLVSEVIQLHLSEVIVIQLLKQKNSLLA